MSYPEPTDADLGCTCDPASEFCPLCAPYELYDADMRCEELHGRSGVEIGAWPR